MITLSIVRRYQFHLDNNSSQTSSNVTKAIIKNGETVKLNSFKYSCFFRYLLSTSDWNKLVILDVARLFGHIMLIIFINTLVYRICGNDKIYCPL